MDKNGIPERLWTLRYPVFTRKKIMSAANWNLSGQSPSILLRKTVLSLKVPTGAFIVLLRSTNANFQISLCK